MKNNIDEKTKKKIIGIIKVIFPEAKIYLFGSRAKSEHREFSDIDIAIDTGKKLSRFDVVEIADMLSASKIPFRIDVVDVHSVNEEMKNSILQEGILWSN